MPSEPAIPKKYSLTWARQVVEQLRDAHTRATDCVLEIYGISLENLASYLARGDSVFNYLKARIKYLDKMSKCQDLDPFAILLLSDERKFISRHADESAQERLDKRFGVCEARRAGSEGLVCDQSAAAGADLPSGFLSFPTP